MTLSVTKTIPIACSAEDGYDFIANPETMPQWAIHNVKSIRKLEGNRWEMETPRGKATLIPHYEKRGGILDHEFIDASEGVWLVSARIVPVGPSESVYIITLPKPENLPAEAFEAGMRLMDDELVALKACIESSPAKPSVLSAPSADAPAPVPSPSSQTVEALYAAFGRRDMPAIFHLLSTDVEVVQSEKLPWGGRYNGHDGARQFLAQLGSHISTTLAIERLIDSGDHLAAIGWAEGTVNATGVAYRVPIVHLWQIRDGLIVRAQFFVDHPAMLEALG